LNSRPAKKPECHGMTDRNVRDIVDRTVGKIRKGMYEVLKKRQAEGIPLTLEHKVFLRVVDEEMEKTNEKRQNHEYSQ